MINNEEFNVIVCGSREFTNYNLLKETCDTFLSDRVEKGYKIVIISGGARGADSLGEQYAKEKGYDLKVVPAQWDKYGKRAGYLRNNKMAEIGNACIAFLTDAECKRTKMMVRIARDKHLLVREVKEETINKED